jgi:hypothetical protein
MEPAIFFCRTGFLRISFRSSQRGMDALPAPSADCPASPRGSRAGARHGQGRKGQRQAVGTIIVSVTDEPFSDENPEHVKIANAIEIRLVDQDLLPLFTDL